MAGDFSNQRERQKFADCDADTEFADRTVWATRNMRGFSKSIGMEGGKKLDGFRQRQPS